MNGDESLDNDVVSLSEGLFGHKAAPSEPMERVGVNVRADLTRLIGQTPMVFLNNLGSKSGATIVCELDSMNPSTSAADRVALAFIEGLEAEGAITPHKSILVEATCGSGGAGLAFVGAVKGYKVICVIPETVPMEKRAMIMAYGAQLVVTPGTKGIPGATYKASQIVQETSHAV